MSASQPDPGAAPIVATTAATAAVDPGAQRGVAAWCRFSSARCVR